MSADEIGAQEGGQGSPISVRSADSDPRESSAEPDPQESSAEPDSREEASSKGAIPPPSLGGGGVGVASDAEVLGVGGALGAPVSGAPGSVEGSEVFGPGAELGSGVEVGSDVALAAAEEVASHARAAEAAAAAPRPLQVYPTEFICQ